MLAALCVTSNCLSTYRRLTHPVTACSLEPVNRLLKSRRYHPAINAAQPAARAQRVRPAQPCPWATIRGLSLSLKSGYESRYEDSNEDCVQHNLQCGYFLFERHSHSRAEPVIRVRTCIHR